MNVENQRKSFGKAPQPAPRLSISRNNTQNISTCESSSNFTPENSPRKMGELTKMDESLNDGNHFNDSTLTRTNGILPPPLPPKPRLKIAQQLITNSTDNDKIKENTVDDTKSHVISNIRSIKGPIAERINMLTSAAAAAEKKLPQPRTIYFDQLNSSFV